MNPSADAIIHLVQKNTDLMCEMDRLQGRLELARQAIAAARSVFSEEPVREAALCYSMFAVFEEKCAELDKGLKCSTESP